jgi:acid phosphatase class B
MKQRKNCLVALGFAIAVNAAALMAVNSAMVDAAERELLSQQQPVQVVVITAKRQDLEASQTVASRNCAASKTL